MIIRLKKNIGQRQQENDVYQGGGLSFAASVWLLLEAFGKPCKLTVNAVKGQTQQQQCHTADYMCHYTDRLDTFSIIQGSKS